MKLREFICLLKKASNYGDTRLSKQELLETEIKFQYLDGRELAAERPYLVTEDDECECPYISVIVEEK